MSIKQLYMDMLLSTEQKQVNYGFAKLSKEEEEALDKLQIDDN